jgi:hypothetical protein
MEPFVFDAEHATWQWVSANVVLNAPQPCGGGL